MRKCLVFDVLANFGTRRWHRVPLRARQLHQTSRDTSRPCAHSSDIAMPRHLPISAPRLFDIPTVRLRLDTPAVTGCGIGLAGVLGRACHSVASSAPSSCHSVGSSGYNLLANCGFDRFCATRWRRVYRHRATRWRRVHRLRATRWRRVHRLHATRWRRVAIICPPTAVLSAFAPLGGVEWRDTEAAVTLGISVEPQRHSLSSSGATGMFRVPLCVARWRHASPVVSLREKPSSHAPRRTCQTGCAIM